MLIQFIIIVVIILILLRIFSRWRKKEITIKKFIGWLIFWLVAAIVVLLPQTVNFLANLTGVGRGVDVVIYLALITIFYIIFRIFVRLDKMEKNITKIVQHIALNKEDDNKSLK